MEPPPLPEPGAAVPAHVANARVEPLFPVWGLGDVARVVGFTIGSWVFFSVLFILIATSIPSLRGKHPEVPAAVMAMIVSEIGFLWFAHRMISFHYRRGFWKEVQWNWPQKWPIYVAAGVLLQVLAQFSLRFFTLPKNLPIDELFNNPYSFWMMIVLAVCIAPAAEELFFRGLLYPVLVGRIGIAPAIGVVSVFFALVHAAQLGWSVPAVSLMVIVGFALTLVRAYANSLAASFLLHVSYNGFLFILAIQHR